MEDKANETDAPGVKERIKERLLSAADAESLMEIRQDLKDEGENPGSINACVSDLRKHGQLRFEKARTTTALMKPSPVELLISQLRLPEIVNGQREVFDAGVDYAMKTIVIAVRISQELSAMGIAQSRPLLLMAQELRQSDKQAMEAAQAASERVLANVMPELQSLRESAARNAAKTPPPPPAPPPKDMDEVIARPMGKLVERMVDMAINQFMPGAGNGQDPNISYETRTEAPAPAPAASPAEGKIETETRQAEAEN